MMKSWFGRGPKTPSGADLSINDLIVLERWEEAEQRLKAHLKKTRRDLRSQFKLGEVYAGSRQFDKAVEQYAYVAEEYARDGFYDKSKALISKALKLRPLDEKLQQRAAQLDQVKRFEHSRVVASEGLMASQGGDSGTHSAATIQLQALWSQLAGTPLLSLLDNAQLRQLFTALELKGYLPGETLVSQGQTLPRIFLIGKGIIEAVVTTGSAETQLRTFSSGDVIGERALLEQKPWPATYRVSEKARLLVLSREGLEKCLVGNSNPKGFLDALREQRLDQEVASAVQRLGG